MYKAIVFDLDDTLYDYEKINEKANRVLCSYVCDRFNISTTMFHCTFNKAREDTKIALGHTGASHNRILYCQKTLEYLGIPPAESALDLYEVYWGYMLDHMQLRDGVLDLLQYCRLHNVKTGICSDLTAHIQHRKIRRLGIAAMIDKIVTSEEAGAEKPNPLMFKIILDKLEVEAKDAIFVGDNLKKDVEGAQKMGMKALWFHEKGGQVNSTITSFGEVKAIIHGSK